MKERSGLWGVLGGSSGGGEVAMVEADGCWGAREIGGPPQRVRSSLWKRRMKEGAAEKRDEGKDGKELRQ